MPHLQACHQLLHLQLAEITDAEALDEAGGLERLELRPHGRKARQELVGQRRGRDAHACWALHRDDQQIDVLGAQLREHRPRDRLDHVRLRQRAQEHLDWSGRRENVRETAANEPPPTCHVVIRPHGVGRERKGARRRQPLAGQRLRGVDGVLKDAPCLLNVVLVMLSSKRRNAKSHLLLEVLAAKHGLALAEVGRPQLNVPHHDE